MGKIISHPEFLAFSTLLANMSGGTASLTSSQGILGILSHGISFIQDHKLKPFPRRTNTR